MGEWMTFICAEAKTASNEDAGRTHENELSLQNFEQEIFTQAGAVALAFQRPLQPGLGSVLLEQIEGNAP